MTKQASPAKLRNGTWGARVQGGAAVGDVVEAKAKANEILRKVICQHQATREIAESGYTGSVAVYPYTAENPAAHGCITVTVECRHCGARRAENRNQWHREYGTWGPTRSERERTSARSPGRGRADNGV
jgi:hypothetical protein